MSTNYVSTVKAPVRQKYKSVNGTKIYYPHCYIELSVQFQDNSPDYFDAGGAESSWDDDPAPTRSVPSASTTASIPNPSKVYTLPPIEPRDCRVFHNNIHDADTFECTFETKLFPFSPEMMKTAGIRIFMFQTDHLITDAQDEIIQNMMSSANFGTNLTLVGIIDHAEYEASLEGGGGYFFRVSGRDLTSLLIDRVWTTEFRANLNKNIVDVVQDISDVGTGWLRWDSTGHALVPGPAQENAGYNNTTLGLRLKVQWLDGTGTWHSADQLNSSVEASRLNTTANVPTANFNQRQKSNKTQSAPKPVPNHTSGQHTHKNGRPIRKKTTYWDAITHICNEIGMEVFVRGYVIYVADPNTLALTNYNTNKYNMMFGNNIRKYKMIRKMNKESIPQIKVYYYDSKSKQNKNVTWPTSNNRTVNNIAIDQSKVLEVPLGHVDYSYNNNREEIATNKAKALYNTLSRNEATVEISTCDLADLSDEQRDLLHLRVGYPIILSFNDQFRQQFSELSVEQRFSYLLDQEYPTQIANQFASDWDRINDFNQQEKYTQEIRWDWSVRDGFKIEIKAINYINPINDALISVK